MRIIVTGASGFIGKNFLERIDKEHRALHLIDGPDSR